MISQPVNQVRLTNIAIVRLKVKGKVYEVPCYKNQIMNYRQGLETDLDEVLQIREVFRNVNKGVSVKHAELFKTFKTSNFEEILREILDRGTV
jgi:ribosome maturation protein SDO1